MEKWREFWTYTAAIAINLAVIVAGIFGSMFVLSWF